MSFCISNGLYFRVNFIQRHSRKPYLFCNLVALQKGSACIFSTYQLNQIGKFDFTASKVVFLKVCFAYFKLYCSHIF